MNSSWRPLVSIITPSFERRQFLETCLASVAIQEYPDVEHIVVDGGSRDGTTALLRDWATTGKRRWVSEPDEGMYHAINKGFAMARGEVLAYLNTDDAYLPWSIGTAVEVLEDGWDAVFGDLLVVKHDRGAVTSYVQFYPPFSMEHYVWKQSIGQPTMFWRRSVAEGIGLLDTSYRLIGDCEYWLRMGSAGSRIAKVDEVLAIQVDHGETLRETRSEELRAEFSRLRNQYAGSRALASTPISALCEKARWRVRNAQMALACSSVTQPRWPRFVAYLRAGGPKLRRTYAMSTLLPYVARRPLGLSIVDGLALIERIREEGGQNDSPARR